MSVMNRLKQLSEEGNEPYVGPNFQKAKGTAEMEQMMQTAPIPGQSLTQDPDSRLPYEQPPEYTDLQTFLDEAFLEMSEPDDLPQLLDVMRKGVPVEHIAQKYLEQKFAQGKISVDMLMSSIEPIIYTLISLATYGSVDPVLYPEDDMIDPDSDDVTPEKLYKRASADLLADEDPGARLTVTDLQAPATMPKSLLARSKEAVESINTGA